MILINIIMNNISHKNIKLDTQVEEGLTITDAMVMAAESMLIKNGIIKGTSFHEAFKHLHKS